MHIAEEERLVAVEAYADTTVLVRSEHRTVYAEAENLTVEVGPDMDTSLYVVAESRGLVVESEERNVIVEACDVQMA